MRKLHCQIYSTFFLTPILLTTKYQCNHLKKQMQSYKSTLFLAPQHIQFTTHYFDFESKKLYGNRCRSSDPPKINRKCAKIES